MLGLWTVIKEALSSKKFIVAIVGIIVAAAGHYGLNLDPEAVEKIIYVIAAYLLGQGIADHGKEAAKVEAVAEASRGLSSPDEAIKAVKNT